MYRKLCKERVWPFIVAKFHEVCHARDMTVREYLSGTVILKDYLLRIEKDVDYIELIWSVVALVEGQASVAEKEMLQGSAKRLREHPFYALVMESQMPDPIRKAMLSCAQMIPVMPALMEYLPGRLYLVCYRIVSEKLRLPCRYAVSKVDTAFVSKQLGIAAEILRHPSICRSAIAYVQRCTRLTAEQLELPLQQPESAPGSKHPDLCIALPDTVRTSPTFHSFSENTQC